MTEQVDLGSRRVGRHGPDVTGPREEAVDAGPFLRREGRPVLVVREHRQRALVAVELGVEAAEQADGAPLGGAQDRLDQGRVGLGDDLLDQEEAEDDVHGPAACLQPAFPLRELADVTRDGVDPHVGQQGRQDVQARLVAEEALGPVGEGDRRPGTGRDVGRALGQHGVHDAAQRVGVAEAVLLGEVRQGRVGEHGPVDVGVLEPAQCAGDVEFEQLEAGGVAVEVGAGQRQQGRARGGGPLDHGRLDVVHADGAGEGRPAAAEEPVGQLGEQRVDGQQVGGQGVPLGCGEEHRRRQEAVPVGDRQQLGLARPAGQFAWVLAAQGQLPGVLGAQAGPGDLGLTQQWHGGGHLSGRRRRTPAGSAAGGAVPGGSGPDRPARRPRAGCGPTPGHPDRS